jgi:3-dehydroquinate synthase
MAFTIKDENYSIHIKSGILSNLGDIFSFDGFSKIGILTDVNIKKYWMKSIEKGIGRKIIPIVVPSGEGSKKIEKAIEIWKIMFKEGFDRHSLLINLGGGMITDLGGFVAGTFMRGIKFLQIPTSLLSQVDASVGGKNGVNLEGMKNCIGTFNDPIGIVIDVKTLTTLPERELISAFSEIIKHGTIADKKYFDLATSKKADDFSREELVEIIKKSIRIKSDIVKNDRSDRNSRKVLNFGHTIGHAIESLSLKTKKPLLHGEAVALGMIAESKLSHLLGILSEKDFHMIENGIEKAGLPVRIKKFPILEIMKMIRSDKKNIGHKVKWSLPKKIGEVIFDADVPDDLVIQAVRYIQV